MTSLPTRHTTIAGVPVVEIGQGAYVRRYPDDDAMRDLGGRIFEAQAKASLASIPKSTRPLPQGAAAILDLSRELEAIYTAYAGGAIDQSACAARLLEVADGARTAWGEVLES